MSSKLNLTGQQFGKLTCLNMTDKRSTSREVIWRCKCSCGKICEISTGLLQSGGTKSCGCLRKDLLHESYKISNRLPKGLAAFRKLLRQYKRDAKKRKLVFELSVGEFKKLTGGSCHYCGQKPSQIVGNKDNYGQYIYNGIDRIDNTKGYITTNCVPCCKVCNYMKKDLSTDEFVSRVKKIVKNMIDRYKILKD